MCDKKDKYNDKGTPLYDTEDLNTFMVNPTPPEGGIQREFESAKIDVHKSFVGTGMTELEPCNDKPKLEGEIIFCHGYQSSPGHNEEGTFWNAPTKQNPDDPGFFTKKGENADEYDHTSQDDIYTNDELNSDLPQSDRKKDLAIRKALKNDGFMKFSDARQHWNYWNGISNKFAATEEYARYFNATGREHYINGSHGMGSAANHRIDHGISLGYTWAQGQWHIFDRETLEKNKKNVPSCESCSPAYKPVTVVGHSQGCATAVGVVLGIMRYAMDLKWEEIPINIILLGVHQNYGFHESEYNYTEDVLEQKSKKYEIANADFWDGYPKSPTFNEADKVKSMFNGLSHVFDVSNHRLGIDQHGEAITNKWSDIKGRAVQFTFCNDRGDTVFRDGDIKTMDCAGSPEPDTSFLSVEFFKNGDSVEPQSDNFAEVTITPKQSRGFGGTLTIPCYAINKRLEFKDISELKDDELWKDHQAHKPEWTNYRTLAIEWAEAFDRFKFLKQQYEQELTKWREQVMRRAEEQRYAPRPRLSTDVIKAQAGLKESRREMIYKYGRIQEADLYAHFSPVSLISDSEALSDWGGARAPDDSVGTKENVWERIKAVGENKFYKPKYGSDKESLTNTQKRKDEKKYVEGDGKANLIPTYAVNTDYITKIIDEHVLNPNPKSIWEHIKEWRYDKDWFKRPRIFIFALISLIMIACNMDNKKTQEDPVPYLHELTDNPNYEVKMLIPKDFQVGNPDDYLSTFSKIYFDKTNKNLIVKSKKRSPSSKNELLSIKADSVGNLLSKVQTVDNIVNNGIYFGNNGYSKWILNNDTTYHRLKPLLNDKEKDDIDKWLPKFKQAYQQAEYVYLPTSFTEYHMLVDGTWYLMRRQEDTPSGFRNKYPAKNPPGRMIALEDITPDFFADSAERDTSLIKVLGYGQEYFEEGQGDNPINGSAGHYYMQLNMKKDTLRFKRFGTMGTQLTIYKIPKELGGHPDVVFIVQTRNAMFPDRELGGMYVVRPRDLSK